MGSMIICRMIEALPSDPEMTEVGWALLWVWGPAHLSIIFEIFVRPAQLLYQNWI